MERGSFRYSRFFIVLVVVLVILGLAGFGLSFVIDFGAKVMSGPGKNIASAGKTTVSFWNVLTSWQDWEVVFDDLQKERSKAANLEGRVESLEEENMALRSMAGFAQRNNVILIGPAGIFSARPSSLSNSFLISKGSREGVKVNDVIVSDKSDFMGVVSDVKETYSVVRDIRSSQTQITVRIIGKETRGLARGKGDDELNLELVTQGDQVSEGDIVVSSGNDVYPPGLIVGEISHVVSNTTDIFKEVRIKPSILNAGPVVFIISL